jgi:asparagine synthase (glutamine-hydrolysing)
MCGILGFFGSPCEEVETLLLELLHHRGPDDSAVIHNKFGSFGQTRLSILGLEEGVQPITDSLGNILVYNGEIYNCFELQKQFLKTSYGSDSRILFELLKEKGTHILSKLRGMFAFAFYDAQENSLLLSRDALGMKPLYYTRRNEGIFFSSELRPLKPLEPDFERVLEYLFWSRALPGRSLYKDVDEVLAGEWIRFKNGHQERGHFLTLEDILTAGEGKITDLETALAETTSAHLLSDVPVGLLLSGGLDSSSLALTLHLQGVKNLDCYSLGYDNPEFDESREAEALAKYLGFSFHRVPFPERNLKELLQEALGAMDQPFGDPSFIPTYVLTQAVSKEKKVVLGGDGGDEIFFGYAPFLVEGIFPRLGSVGQKLCLTLANFLGKPSRGRVDFAEKLLRFSWGKMGTVLERHSAYMASACPDLHPQKARQNSLLLAKNLAMTEVDLNQPWMAVLYFYFRLYLANLVLVKTDRASMANSLEVRCPYLDLDFIAKVFQPPGSGFPVTEKPKKGLRKFLKTHLPKRYLNFKKRGFSTPLQKVLPLMKEIITDKQGKDLGIRNEHFINHPYLMYNILVYLYFHPRESIEEFLQSL